MVEPIKSLYVLPYPAFVKFPLEDMGLNSPYHTESKVINKSENGTERHTYKDLF